MDAPRAVSEAVLSESKLIRCPSCAATNCVPPEKFQRGRTPLCGRCQSGILLDDKPGRVIDAAVERSPLPVLLHQWAASCSVRRIPTVLMYEAGQKVDRIVGFQSKSQVAGRLGLVP